MKRLRMNRKDNFHGNRCLALCLAVMLLAACLPLNALADQTGTVKGGWLILRDAPSFNGKIRSSYPTGTVVTITGKNGSWYAVKAPDGLTGYMLGTYLTVSGSESGSSSSGYTAYVTSRNGLNVRLRTGPGKGYTILASYAPGTACTVLSTGTNWSKIQIGTSTGYMMTEFLTTTPGSTTPSTPSNPTGYAVWVTSRNGKGVNLRAGAGKEFASIGFYSVGTAATMVSSGTTWSYIQVGSRSGYMMTEFLTTTQPETAPAGDGSGIVTSANGKSVNLRSGPGKNYKVLLSLKVGTRISIVLRGSTWDYVRYGNTYGFMMKQFITDTVVNPATPTDLF